MSALSLFARLGGAFGRSSDREDADAHDPEWLERATRFEYYWYNAQKKIDLRRLEGFGPLADRVQSEGRTFLHIDRLYTLWQAIAAMPPDATAVIEVGVFQGGSTKFLAEALKVRGLTSVPVYACDTFNGHTIVDDELDRRHKVGKQFAGVNMTKLTTYLEGLAAIRLVQGDIRDTCRTFESEQRFGLVHIDVDVYPITKFCLEFFAPRVVRGGMIVVDDYGFKTCPGAKKAVDEFAAISPQYRMIHLMSGQASLIHLGR